MWRFSTAISSRNLLVSVASSAVDSLRISVIFMLRLLLCQEFGLNWQFVCGQAHCFTGYFFGDTLHFKQDGTRANLGDEEFRTALATTHLDVQWLARNRSMWEYSDPDFATTLNVASHCL